MRKDAAGITLCYPSVELKAATSYCYPLPIGHFCNIFCLLRSSEVLPRTHTMLPVRLKNTLSLYNSSTQELNHQAVSFEKWQLASSQGRHDRMMAAWNHQQATPQPVVGMNTSSTSSGSSWTSAGGEKRTFCQHSISKVRDLGRSYLHDGHIKPSA